VHFLPENDSQDCVLKHFNNGNAVPHAFPLEITPALLPLEKTPYIGLSSLKSDIRVGGLWAMEPNSILAGGSVQDPVNYPAKIEFCAFFALKSDICWQ